MHFCTGYIHFLPHFSQSHLIITSTTLPEHMDRRRAARPTDIVGNADPCAVDLALLRLAAQLLGHLVYLRHSRRADRMALRLQAAGAVDRDVPVQLRAPFPDELLRLPLPAQAEILIGHQLDGGERVVEVPAVKV